jgi:hypothetical protein
MNRLCHSKTLMCDITLSTYISFYIWKHSVSFFFFFFFQFHKKFQIDALLDFHPSHESNRATQHGHTQSSETNQLT